MLEPPDEFRRLLAFAFDRAWKRYYRPSRIGAISESMARPALAQHLIELAKKRRYEFGRRLGGARFYASRLAYT
jgi:hypothetical protein